MLGQSMRPALALPFRRAGKASSRRDKSGISLRSRWRTRRMVPWQCGHGRSVDWAAVTENLNLLKPLIRVRQLTHRPVDRIFELISAGLARPYVSSSMIGEMLRPLRFD